MSDGGDSVDFRPPSDNLVDLHISIVPLEHWVERLNYASHKVIGDTFSVGFIRVLPDISIAKLRMELQVQLGHDFFPKDYVFLKHIGRCLALVRQNQEKQLKVKNFLPPHSVMPEIFVLPGHPTMYNYSVLPPIKPRIQDLHRPISETESTSPENISYDRRQSIPQQQQHPQSFGEIDSLSASYNNTPQNTRYIRKDQSLGHANQIRHSLGMESSTTHAKFKSSVGTPPENIDIKRQKRHISGKSENHQKFPKGQRGRTTPGQAFDESSKTFDKQNERPPVTPAYIESEGKENHELRQTKSVIHEGPVKRKVHYNMPARSGSLASSRGMDEKSHMHDEMDDKPPTNSTNDDSGYLDQEQSDTDISSANELQRHRIGSQGQPEDMRNSPSKHENVEMVQRGPVQQQPSPSPIRIPQFHKPPVEQQEVVTSPVSPKGLVNSKGKAPATTSKHQQQSSAQEATLDKRKDNKDTAKRLDSSHRSKLWRELQEVRNKRRQAEKERQDLVKQAKITTSKLNQKRISVSAAPPSERPRFPRIKSGKKKQQGPGEKCNVSGCYYVFHTNMDKKRHFGLIHRGKSMGTSVQRQDSSSALNWKRSILTQESLSSVGDNRQPLRRKSAFGSSLPRLAPSDRKVRFSLTECSAKAPPPSQGQAYWASEDRTISPKPYASCNVSESTNPSCNTTPPTKYRLRFCDSGVEMWHCTASTYHNMS